MKKLLFPIVAIIAILSITANVLLYLRYSSSRPLITVNGVPISRKTFQDRVDLLYATPLLRQLIWQQIVFQAAAKNNCTPTDQDLNEAIDLLQRSSPNVIENARRTDPSLTLFKEDLKSSLALRNLRMQGIDVSQDDIQAYYDLHKNDFKLPQQSQTTLVITNSQEDANTAERLLQNGVAPTIIAQQPGLSVIGLNAKLNSPLPSYVGQQVLAMKNGDVKIIPLGSNYAVVRVKSVASAGVPPLSQIEDQVRVAAVLSKAPSELDELRKLRSQAQITAQIGKYANVIPDDPSEPQSPSPTQ